MFPRPSAGKIRPKLSNMPRQKTEAAAYLDMYKLAIEKKRLLDELQIMEQRRTLIQQRLAVIDTQIAIEQNSVQQLQENAPQATPTPSSHKGIHNLDNFETLFLEY